MSPVSAVGIIVLKHDDTRIKSQILGGVVRLVARGFLEYSILRTHAG